MDKSLIKVLIVDDDTIVRRGLRATINWSHYGMKVISEAPNGKRGWEEFLKYHPDIVITDIVMPEENGLDFARRIKAYSPRTKILLLSCHKDFEYAQEGLKLGASGYILKTVFEDSELDHFLTSFQQELSQSTKEVLASDIQESFDFWIRDDQSDFDHQLEMFFKNDWSWMNQPFYVYLIYKSTASLLKSIPKTVNSVSLSVNDSYTFIFIEQAFHQTFLGNLIELKARQKDLDWIYEGPLSGMQEWMKVVRAFHHAQKEGLLFECPNVIIMAIDYIVRNLSNPMSVSDIAKEVKMSRSHLSTSFKRATGESIHSYIEKKRLQWAKQLLNESKLTIQEIGELIGIMDAKYFSKWFKRCTGFPPSNYRIQQKDDIGQTNWQAK